MGHGNDATNVDKSQDRSKCLAAVNANVVCRRSRERGHVIGQFPKETKKKIREKELRAVSAMKTISSSERDLAKEKEVATSCEVRVSNAGFSDEQDFVQVRNPVDSGRYVFPAIQGTRAINAEAGLSALCKCDETGLGPCSLGSIRMKPPSSGGDSSWSSTYTADFSILRTLGAVLHLEKLQITPTMVLYSSGHQLMLRKT